MDKKINDVLRISKFMLSQAANTIGDLEKVKELYCNYIEQQEEIIKELEAEIKKLKNLDEGI